MGQRNVIYAPTLRQLREKEKSIPVNMPSKSYSEGQVTVCQLVERYLSLRTGLRRSTLGSYEEAVKFLYTHPFGKMRIRDVRRSDAQKMFIELSQNGRSLGSLQIVRNVLRPAFQMACEEGVLQKNPFDFDLSKIVPNQKNNRDALSEKQQADLLNFARNDTICRKYYDWLVVLLGTGLREGELAGLTEKDLDFENGLIHVRRQVYYVSGVGYEINPPKTNAGMRSVPMTPEVRRCLLHALANRPKPKVEKIVKGCTGFVFVRSSGSPRIGSEFGAMIRELIRRHDRMYPDEPPFPHITPHILRHTFCTNMINAGMNVKTLQYIMGHSSAQMTLNVYAHTSYKQAMLEMDEIARRKSARCKDDTKAM